MSDQANQPMPHGLAALPDNFLFGTATAAYQIEGGVDQGGRGKSIWDTFVETPGAIHRGDTGEIACDHFHRWESDLDLMSELGYPSYRLSLSWARLQPEGRGPLNPEGVEFYRNIIQGCIARSITPLVTLYHWDLPQTLQDEGGWPARQTAFRFGDYAALCFAAFGDIADEWITINEPWCVSFLSHAWGVQAPGLRDDRLALRAAHHTLLAHGLALEHARSIVADATVGITNLLSNVEPKTDDPADIEACKLMDVRMNRIFLDPLYRGEYSEEVLAVFAADGLADTGPDAVVQPGDLALISKPSDFVGINHYTNVRAYAVGPDADPALSWGGVGLEHVEPTPSTFGWSDTPAALGAILRRVVSEYSTLPIIVTENGITLNDYVDPNGTINDVERIAYLKGYIEAVASACADGVAVRGYFAWSFLDNFEWAEGYDKRFGLVFVDFRTQDRIPKASASWYGQAIQAFENQRKLNS